MTGYGTSADVSVRAALDAYLAANGLGVETYAAPAYEVDLGEVTGEVWAFPNGPARKRAIPLHDLHHVVTGYGTDVTGEAEIGAWELAAGCNSVFLWWINLGAVGLGLLLNPLRTLRAVARGLGQRTLYRDPLPYPALLELTVGDLRERLGVPVHGHSLYPSRLHRRAPGRRDGPRLSLPAPLRTVIRVLSTPINRACGGVRRSQVEHERSHDGRDADERDA